MRSLALLFVVAACHPHTASLPIPSLPGDGDANVAKPPTGGQKPVVDDPWAGKTDLIAAPAAKPPQKLELPHIDQFKLSNGLDVYVIKSDRLPVLSVQLAIRAGRMYEPRARLGVAEATADMLVKGTKKRDAATIAKSIDFVGGTIAAEATYEATHVSCSVLARNADTCLQLLPDMIAEPSFPDDELARVKERLLAGVRQRLDDASLLAAVHVQNLLWGNDHVRGWADSEASVSALRREDLIAFHKAWYAPNNSIMVISGDVDPKKLKGDLERAFGGWKKTAVSPPPSFPEAGLSGIRIRLVDKPGQTQTHIRIGQFGIKHEDPRFFDTLVWNYALGGGVFSSRLMKVVRSQGGKTYGVQSTFDRNVDKGSFVVSTFTRNSEAVATTKLITAEIAKMAKEGPTQDEVEAAIANLAGGYGMRFQAASDFGAQLLGAELHNFGFEYLQNYPLAIAKVDVASAKQAASEILDPRNYVVVLVGDAKDLEPQLKKEGWRYEKVAFNDPINPEVQAPEPPADPKALAAAKQLLDDALAVKGGKKLAALKAFRWVGKGTSMMGGNNVGVEVKRTYELPDKLRVDATLNLPDGPVTVVVAVVGNSGWTAQLDAKGQGKSMDLPPAEFGGIDFERWHDPDLILLKATDKAAKIKPMQDETIDGKPNAVIKLASPFRGVDVAISIDRKSKLVTRVAFSDGKLSQSDEFTDYRDVGGVKFAFKRKSINGTRVTTVDLEKVELDPKIEDTTFVKPSK